MLKTCSVHSKIAEAAGLFEKVIQRDAGGDDNGSSDARTYLIFHLDGSASLGRREADGQWTAQRCRFRCLPGGLLMVHRCEGGEGEGSGGEDGGESNNWYTLMSRTIVARRVVRVQQGATFAVRWSSSASGAAARPAGSCPVAERYLVS